MSLRRPVRTTSSPISLSLFSFFLIWASAVVAIQDDNNADSFSCQFSIGSLKYDMTPLAGPKSVTRERETPPSTMLDSLRFDLCDELPALDDVPQGDQCETGTRACLTKTNRKGDNSDRIVAVIPVAQTASLRPDYSTISSPDGVSLKFHGASYPASASSPTPQSLRFSLICNKDSTSDPVFSSYENGEVHVEWNTTVACGRSADDKPDNEDETPDPNPDSPSSEKVGSGIGWFFLVLLLAILAYFGVGAYYNYSNYGARGLDLIPHRTFWREVPYMLQDVVSHLCSSVRPRRMSNRGYIAV
ncbi:hypothetical protein CONPUDRAFT_136231 [Coniophora puteana RWD-64-598 SS2]|uniref:Autophagy-related protein 27 n=1 Tax=Coniophora puteana (strain RWD-64-598) TaxID=741705 RepID=A0A5M3MV85_CONPW|nr:uncharacterized protein CONPUDRAFT_136231 [Coniophora puteana RWD-64-598 SS2]EIW83078.1 hypothetical protein CONPUDRAFT_136231 [Coniophora puteana RWD-64-598 SS2]